MRSIHVPFRTPPPYANKLENLTDYDDEFDDIRFIIYSSIRFACFLLALYCSFV